jgi:hypothetical protein
LVPQRLDPGSQIVEGELLGLQGIVEATQAPADIGYLGHDGLQALASLARRCIHLLVHQAHQLTEVVIGEDALLDLVYHHPLELVAIEIRGLAGACALLEQGAADVVAEPAALGFLADQGLAAVSAAGQAAEQVVAACPARVQIDGRPFLQERPHPAERLPVYNRLPGLLDADGRCLLAALARTAPDKGARVGLIRKDLVESGLAPLLAPGGRDAFAI